MRLQRLKSILNSWADGTKVPPISLAHCLEVQVGRIENPPVFIVVTTKDLVCNFGKKQALRLVFFHQEPLS